MDPIDHTSHDPADAISLSALNQHIGVCLKNAFPGEYWITAEISEMTVNQTGHCYLELIEKDQDNDQLLARNKAIIWSYTFRMLKPFFETTTGISLSPGIKIMAQVQVSFHEVYGLSLTVKDINPGFTIGEMALRKQEVIRQLKEEGIFDMNRRLLIPEVPQRIAVISSAHAAGFQDFITHLDHNEFLYAFEWTLFPVMMQGKETEPTVISALEDINGQTEDFDLVVIIRGGGAQADLEAFNRYRIAAHVAQFPLPVITGIGHEKDESITDLVARINLKTPTAVAQFLIDRMVEFEQTLIGTVNLIRDAASLKINSHRTYLREKAYTLQSSLLQTIHQNLATLHHFPYRFRSGVQGYYNRKEHQLNTLSDSITYRGRQKLDKSVEKLNKWVGSFTHQVLFNIEKQTHALRLSQKVLVTLDPVNTLKRGYSITRKGTKVIRDSADINPGDTISTQFEKGSRESKVI